MIEVALAPLRARSHALRAKLHQRLRLGNFTIAVYGNSVPNGRDCVDPASRTFGECAYPGRLARMLRHAFANSTVRVIDHTFRATTSARFLTLPDPLTPVDLFLCDFSLTDGAQLSPWEATRAVFSLGQRLSRRAEAPALLFVETAEDALLVRPDMAARAHELWSIVDAHAAALRALGAPWISWRDAYWPAFGTPPSKVYWDAHHPSWKVHQMIADVCFVALWRLAHGCEASAHRERDPPPLQANASSSGLPSLLEGAAAGDPASCLVREPFRTHMQVDASAHKAERARLFPAVDAVNFALAEDVAGKPGWLTGHKAVAALLSARDGGLPPANLSVRAAVVSFNATASSRGGGAVVVGYLRTYDEHMGCANVTFTIRGQPGQDRGPSGHVLLDGYWQTAISLDESYVWALPPPAPTAAEVAGADDAGVGVLVRVEMLPPASCPERRKSRGPPTGTKFKITQLSSC